MEKSNEANSSSGDESAPPGKRKLTTSSQLPFGSNSEDDSKLEEAGVTQAKQDPISHDEGSSSSPPLDLTKQACAHATPNVEPGAHDNCLDKLPDVGDLPNQPLDGRKFPQRSFGKGNVVHQAFQAIWFQRWKWLHYDEAKDLAFCHICIKAVRTGKMKMSGNAKDSSFLFPGFCNRKNATAQFNSHEQSATHKLAVSVLVKLPSITGNVGQQLSSGYAQACAVNQRCLTIIVQNICFLACQGVALRGNEQAELNSNFLQLLRLRSVDNSDMKTWLERNR